MGGDGGGEGGGGSGGGEGGEGGSDGGLGGGGEGGGCEGGIEGGGGGEGGSGGLGGGGGVKGGEGGDGGLGGGAGEGGGDGGEGGGGAGGEVMSSRIWAPFIAKKILLTPLTMPTSQMLAKLPRQERARGVGGTRERAALRARSTFVKAAFVVSGCSRRGHASSRKLMPLWGGIDAHALTAHSRLSCGRIRLY